jgi:hypothetical protein
MSEELFEETLQNDGYVMGSDACLDKCWEEFRQCLKNSSFPDECIARLEACKRSCGQSASGIEDEQP